MGFFVGDCVGANVLLPWHDRDAGSLISLGSVQSPPLSAAHSTLRRLEPDDSGSAPGLLPETLAWYVHLGFSSSPRYTYLVPLRRNILSGLSAHSG